MDRDLIDKFVEVTGESEATAQQYLAVADGNVEVAISLMFEGGHASEAEQVTSEPIVRPPILPTQEVLVPSDPMCSFPRLSNNVFDRFRDFAVETERQEEEMARRVTGVKQISQRKSKRLDDLFRPPCNILFLGSFIDAREHAKTLNRWLLVNIQNPQEFSCQILNRDVWPSQPIQEIVKDHFVLWQVLSNTADGKRYIDFYNVTEYPYLAIIDPRTGECMRTYNHITVDILISTLNDMLSTHPSPESAIQETPSSRECNSYSTSSIERDCLSKTRTDTSSNDMHSKHLGDRLTESDDDETGSEDNDVSASVPSSSFNILNKRRRVDVPDVKEQSNEHTNCKNNELNKPVVDSNKADTSNEPMLRLCLRLPNGGKETMSMVATETIEDFVHKMESMGFSPLDHTYLVPFPKTNVGALSPKIRLLDTILFPSNTVFITKI